MGRPSELDNQLRICELLESKLASRLATELSDDTLRDELLSDSWRAKLLERIHESIPDSIFSKASSGNATAEEFAGLQDSVTAVLKRLEDDPELQNLVDEAREGASAVELGLSMEEIELIRTLAIVSSPIALVIAARIKSLGRSGVEFYEGVPKEIVDIIRLIQDMMPRFNVGKASQG